MENCIISNNLAKKLSEAATVDEVVQACAAEGICVTKEQLDAALAQHTGEELPEDALDCVSGGFTTVLPAIAILLIGTWIANRKK